MRTGLPAPPASTHRNTRRSSAITSSRLTALAPSSVRWTSTPKASAGGAAECLAAAGRRALARGDAHAATNLLERALALVPPTDPFGLELARDVTDALILAGNFERADQVTTAAIEAAGDSRHGLVASLMRADIRTFTEPEGSLERLRDVAEHALPELEKARDDNGLARAWAAIAWTHHLAMRFEAAIDAFERAFTHARRAGDERQANQALIQIGIELIYGPTPAEEAIKRCNAVLEDASISRWGEMGFMDALAVHEAMLGHFDAARELIERVRTMTEDLGLARGLPFILRAEHALDRRDARRRRRRRRDENSRRLRGARSWKMGEKGLLSTQAARLAQSLYAQQRYVEAEDYTKISEQAGASDDIATQMLWRQVRAKALARRGEDGAAEESRPRGRRSRGTDGCPRHEGRRTRRPRGGLASRWSQRRAEGASWRTPFGFTSRRGTSCRPLGHVTFSQTPFKRGKLRRRETNSCTRHDAGRARADRKQSRFRGKDRPHGRGQQERPRNSGNRHAHLRRWRAALPPPDGYAASDCRVCGGAHASAVHGSGATVAGAGTRPAPDAIRPRNRAGVRTRHHATKRSSDRRAPMVRRRHPRSGELDRLIRHSPSAGNPSGRQFRLSARRRNRDGPAGRALVLRRMEAALRVWTANLPTAGALRPRGSGGAAADCRLSPQTSPGRRTLVHVDALSH